MKRSRLNGRMAHRKQKIGHQEVQYVLHEVLDMEAGERLCHSLPLLEKLQSEDLEIRSKAQAIIHTVDLARSLGGYLPVQYYQDSIQEGFGRMKAMVMVDGTNAVPFMRMQREVRGHLAYKSYWDVDMVNCQPTLLLQRLEVMDIPAPLLQRYVQNREDCIKEVQVATGASRDQVKNLFIRLVFLGSPETWLAEAREDSGRVLAELPTWIFELRDELQKNARLLVDHEDNANLRAHYRKSAALEQNPSNPLATQLALYLQTEECRCVKALVNAISADERHVGAIIHDGVLVRRIVNEPNPPERLLNRWQLAIRKETGYDVKLSIKVLRRDPAWLGSIDEENDDLFLKGYNLLEYPDMKRRWEKKSMKIVQSGNYIREDLPKRIIMTEKALVENYKHLCHVIVQRNQDGSATIRKESFINAWIHDPLLRTYKMMTLLPPPLETPKDVYNTWSGFAAENFMPTKPVDVKSSGVRFLLDDFLFVLFDRKQQVLDYFLDWAAQIVQEPSIKPGIAVLLRGEQGAGKNRTADLLVSMFGRDKCMQTSDARGSLFGSFNANREGKFLIVVNEANGADNFGANNLLKDMITSDTFMYSAKYVNSFEMPCYARFIFTTNNDNCIKLEQGDRRFLVIDVSSELRGNAGFFKKLTSTMNDEHVRHEFYTFLKQRDISERNWENSRPNSSAYSEMLHASMEMEYKFLRDFVLSTRFDPIEHMSNTRVSVSSKDLYGAFLIWLRENGPKSKSYETNLTKFGIRISRLVKEGPRAASGFKALTKSRTSNGMGYVIDLPLFIEEMLSKGWITGDELPTLAE
jgi:hypothetical protein